MVTSSVVAGTVLYLKYEDLNLKRPEVCTGRPVIVITPKAKQKDDTVLVVPITSEVGNYGNELAVEIKHKELNRLSPTGRSFAICDKPISVSLDRLEHYRVAISPKKNHVPNLQVGGDDLKFIWYTLIESFSSDTQLRSLRESGSIIRLTNLLRSRRHFSKTRGRKILRKPRRKSLPKDTDPGTRH